MQKADTPPNRRMLLVCTNERPEGKTSCANRGSEALLTWLKDHVNAQGLKPVVRVTRTGCLGLCGVGPNVAVEPDRQWFTDVTEADLPEIARTCLDPLRDAATS